MPPMESPDMNTGNAGLGWALSTTCCAKDSCVIVHSSIRCLAAPSKLRERSCTSRKVYTSSTRCLKSSTKLRSLGSLGSDRPKL